MELLKRIHSDKVIIGVVGLGYVGLPLAVEFGKIVEVIGFDIKLSRIRELIEGTDKTHEVSEKELADAKNLKYTNKLEELRTAEIFIVTVPTPIDEYKRPDLTPLIKASESVGKIIKKGDVVIYESTVYPGCTEEECVPVLEKNSGLRFNVDFFVGYSPERINPGDKEHRVSSIKKVVSGSTPEIAEALKALYEKIIIAGTHIAPSIKVAEAAKVIENTQRDINIAFVNELAKLFNIMGIDTNDVLEAAGTKWNFLQFKPGLVGGHCIGVDPYYLTHKAINLGYNPEIILAGRRINDGMGAYVAGQFIKLMIKKEQKINSSKVLILGITFKENCPDIRNSKVIDIIKELKEFGCCIDLYDPWADPEDVEKEYGLQMLSKLNMDILNEYNGIILAVAHNEFSDLIQKGNLQNNIVLFDVKGFWNRKRVDGRL